MIQGKKYQYVKITNRSAAILFKRKCTFIPGAIVHGGSEHANRLLVSRPLVRRQRQMITSQFRADVWSAYWVSKPFLLELFLQTSRYPNNSVFWVGTAPIHCPKSSPSGIKSTPHPVVEIKAVLLELKHIKSTKYGGQIVWDCYGMVININITSNEDIHYKWIIADYGS